MRKAHAGLFPALIMMNFTKVLLRPLEAIPYPGFTRSRRAWAQLSAVRVPRWINFIADRPRPRRMAGFATAATAISLTFTSSAAFASPAVPTRAAHIQVASQVSLQEARTAVLTARTTAIASAQTARTTLVVDRLSKLRNRRTLAAGVSHIPSGRALVTLVAQWHAQQRAAAAAAAASPGTSVTPAALSATQVPVSGSLMMRAMDWALAQRGKPYIWGGTGPGGFDCSGLIYAAYLALGHPIPRDTYEMLAAVGSVLVPVSSPQRGDLAFYGTGHVELYWAPGVTFGAQQPGTLIGFHTFSGWWAPTAFYAIR
jgi:cell wall-associated NlpC family hydrolase